MVRLFETLSKFFIGHYLLFHSFSVQFKYQPLFSGISICYATFTLTYDLIKA